MNIKTDFYAVTVKVGPDFGKEHEIGCYITNDLADEVAKLVRFAFHGQANGGMDIDVKWYQERVIRTNAGLRLEDAPNGKLTMIDVLFNCEVVEAVLNYVPLLIHPNEIERRSAIMPKGRIEQPKSICEGPFLCVVLTFEPFDDSHKLYVGYYKSAKVANEVRQFFNQLKEGAGFNTWIQPYSDKYVEYDSGKSYVKIDGIDHELKSTCDDKEYLRLIKIVKESIDKRSRNF